MATGGFEIISEVTTKATACSGERDSDWSGWSKNTAPDGHIINRDTVKVEWLSDAGSENTYEMTYDDWVEIISGTGIKFPRTINVRVFARSSKGHCAGRGWSKVKFTGVYVKYK